MTRRTSLPLLLAAAALFGGCVVPSLQDLGERACDPEQEHDCHEDYTCLKGTCVLGRNLECRPGDSEPCGSNTGTCRMGTRACDLEGHFEACLGGTGPTGELCDGLDNDCDGDTDEAVDGGGACSLVKGVCAGSQKACVGGVYEQSCVAATYGPLYEPTETRCDGRDNDCDGQVDEGLVRPCELTEGVCASAVSACVDGGWQPCGQAEYAAASSAWQPQETSCDGKDNDCNGILDGDAEQWVEPSGQPTRPVALPLGTGDRRDLVLAWEQGNQIRTRRVLANGTLDQPIAPSAQVAVTLRSYSPTVLRCKSDSSQCHTLAWFDTRTCPTGTCHRLVLGRLRDEGLSITGNPADAGIVIASAAMGAGLTMQLHGPTGDATDANDVYGAFAHQPEASASGPSDAFVVLFKCDLDNATCSRAALEVGTEPTLAVERDGGMAVVAWQSRTGLRVAAVDLDALAWVGPLGTLTDWTGTSVPVAGYPGEHLPRLARGEQGAWELFTLAPDAGGPGKDLLLHRNGPCAPGNCPLATATPAIHALPPGSTTALALERQPGVDLFALELAVGGSTEAWVIQRNTADAGWAGSTQRRVGTPGSGAPHAVQSGAFTTVVYRAADGGISADLSCGP